MNRPVIIVDPLSSAIELAPAFKARGIPTVAITLKHLSWTGFGASMQRSDFLTGKLNASVIVQEQAIGTEFAVGTVSANGKHYLAHLIQYTKSAAHDRKTVYDFVEFVPYSEKRYGALFDYTQRALDALGIRWGAAHNEIMLTKKGPRLIETGARMCGGPVVEFAREATGSSQADKLVEIYVDGDVTSNQYSFKKTVVAVFLKSPAHGKIANLEALTELSGLTTLLSKHIWFKNGELVPQTVDYLTSIGIIALAGERDSIFQDYKKIRQMEAKVRVVQERQTLS